MSRRQRNSIESVPSDVSYGDEYEQSPRFEQQSPGYGGGAGAPARRMAGGRPATRAERMQVMQVRESTAAIGTHLRPSGMQSTATIGIPRPSGMHGYGDVARRRVPGEEYSRETRSSTVRSEFEGSPPQGGRSSANSMRFPPPPPGRPSNETFPSSAAPQGHHLRG